MDGPIMALRRRSRGAATGQLPHVELSWQKPGLVTNVCSSFSAADLAMSQPSVSKANADIEHAVGLRLLDRSPHGVEPTIYGRALHKRGVAVFDELRQGVKELEFLTDPTSGELSPSR